MTRFGTHIASHANQGRVDRYPFPGFSNWVGEEAEAFDAALAAGEHLDVVASGALLADDMVGAAPIIDDAPRIALLHARHPLMLLADRLGFLVINEIPAVGLNFEDPPEATAARLAQCKQQIRELIARDKIFWR